MTNCPGHANRQPGTEKRSQAADSIATNLIAGGLFYFYKLMVSAQDIRDGILTLVQRKGPQHTISPAEIAQYLRPTQWREILDQVRLVIDSLSREGKIKALKKGDDVHIINS